MSVQLRTEQGTTLRMSDRTPTNIDWADYISSQAYAMCGIPGARRDKRSVESGLKGTSTAVKITGLTDRERNSGDNRESPDDSMRIWVDTFDPGTSFTLLSRSTAFGMTRALAVTT